MAKNGKDKIDIWMPVYIGDYLSATMDLSTEQHGAYLLLLMAYWKKGGPLPVSALQNICHLSGDAWSNAQAMLEPFFDVESKPGFWVQHRAEKEIGEAVKRKTGAVEKAEKAAAARWK